MKKINYLTLPSALALGLFSAACTQQQTQPAGGAVQLAADQQVQDTQIPVKVVPVIPTPVVKPMPVYKPMVKPKQVIKHRPMVKPKQVMKHRPM